MIERAMELGTYYPNESVDIFYPDTAQLPPTWAEAQAEQKRPLIPGPVPMSPEENGVPRIKGSRYFHCGGHTFGGRDGHDLLCVDCGQQSWYDQQVNPTRCPVVVNAPNRKSKALEER